MKETPVGIYHFIQSRFKIGDGSVKVFKNFTWLFFDKCIKSVVGLGVAAWLARYLGQEGFGVWNYALAFIAIVSAFSTLGLDTIFIRDVVRNSENKNQILGSAFFIKTVSSFVAFIVCIILIHFFQPHSSLIKLMVMIMAMSFLFQAFDVIDFYFKSQLQSRYVVFARNIPFLIISLTQVIFIINRAPLIIFAWLFLVESVFAAMLLLVFYKFKGGEISCWKVDKTTTVQLLKNGWPLFIAFISSMLYLKIDQIMIGQILDERSVGIFSAALKIYEIPFYFLVLLTASIFPKLVEVYEKNKELFFKRYSQITSLYTFCSLILLTIFILFGQLIISILFGSNYIEAYYPLIILSIGLVFIYNGMLRSSYLSVSHNEKIIFYATVISAILNILLNYFLIKLYGIVGSAIATLVTQFLSLFISNYFFSETKRIFFIQLEAFYRFPRILKCSLRI